ncbi:hypothetical protein WG907_04520 [Sphingobium sp. AN558]
MSENHPASDLGCALLAIFILIAVPVIFIGLALGTIGAIVKWMVA